MKDDGKTPHRDSEISAFLEHILRRLQQVSRLPTVSSSRPRVEEEACARDCATFSSKRVKKERRILSNMVDQSLINLRETSINHSSLNEAEITGLGPLLQQFVFGASETSYRMCLLAYNARSDPQMDTLRRLGQEVVGDPNAEPIVSAYRTVRHFIGRLAEHIRIGKQLLEDAIRMRHVLDVFQVAKVEPPACVPPPQVDAHTTLDGILTRMFPSKGSNLSEFQFVLGRHEQHVGIEAKVKDQYAKIHAKPPIVHSEIQVLEHFHRHKLRFADGDRFVGTSKFSCFCCKLPCTTYQ
ncbi:hypothetical protein BKA56DRAFT_682024 [Ilyonectria sp. MPI-CAGE-AT-0026]|nr:hypothetical protein BKA56DRAFT_682024 [Ilyonectria sp. MPI-CAGE-AT-0026]